MPTPPSGNPGGQPTDQFWGSPNIQPTQSVEQMTGGMTVGMPLMPPSMNLDPLAVSRQMQAQIQMMEALQTQRLMQHQMSFSAYGRGIPGVQSPTATMADPRVANYELQAMYQMNPYMASAMSASQGGPTMQLAPSYFQTNPRLGMFRPSSSERAPGAIGQSGFMRDFVTLGGVRVPGMKDPWITRSYAAYEDPLDERIAASRRMTGRAESLAGTALTVGMTLGPLALPMGVGATAMTMGVGYAMSGLTDGYYQRRAETNRIQELSQSFSTNYTSGGFRGIGYSLQESAGIMGSLREASAKDSRYNMADYMEVMEKGTQQGLFSFNANPQSTTTKVKDLVNQIDIFMKLAGDPDVQSAIERMGKLQGLGLTTGQMQSSAANLKAFSRMAGTSVDDLMKTAGTYGAQTSVQMGGSAAFGMTIGAMMPGSINAAIQTGGLNPLQVAMHGGEQGASQVATNMWMNEIQSTLGLSLSAFVDQDSKGHYVANKKAVTDWITKGTVPAFSNSANADIVAANLDRLSTMTGDEQVQLRAESTDVLHQIQQILSDNPVLIPFAGKRIVEEQSKSLGMTKDRLLQTKFNEHAHLAATFLSDTTEKGLRRSMNESMATIEATKVSQAVEADQLINRLARQGAIFLNEVNNHPVMGLMGFSQTQRAAAEQAAAEGAKGSYYIQGLGGVSSVKGKLGDFLSPVINSHFGHREPPILADGTHGSSYHWGIDTEGAEGDPIYALMDGIAETNVSSKTKPGHNFDSVKVMDIHGNWQRNVHVKDFTVASGDVIKKGMILGYVANGGGGAHRHTERGERGRLVDPENFVLGLSSVSDEATQLRMLEQDYVDKAVGRFSHEFQHHSVALKNLMPGREKFLAARDKMVEGKATNSTLTGEQLERLSKEILDVGITTDTFNYDTLSKLSTDDAAAAFGHIANAEGPDAQSRRLAMHDLYSIFNAFEPAQADQRLRQASMDYTLGQMPFAMSKAEVGKFEELSKSFKEIGGVRTLEQSQQAEMFGKLLLEGAGLTEGRAGDIIAPYIKDVPANQVAKFTKTFKESYTAFEKVADETTEAALKNGTIKQAAELYNTEIGYEKAVSAAQKGSSRSESSGFFMGDKERESMIQLQDTRYIGVADQIIKDAGHEGKLSEKERSEIAKSLQKADEKMSKETNGHNFGRDAVGQQSVSLQGAMLVELQKLNTNMSKQH